MPEDDWINMMHYGELALGILTAIFSGFSLWLVCKGYKLAEDYLKQHNEKVTLERRRLAAENGLRALLYLDHSVTMLFNTAKLIKAHKYSPLKTRAKSQVAHVSPEFRAEAEQYALTAEIFRENYIEDLDSLMNKLKEVQLNGELIKDPKFKDLFNRYDSALKALVDGFNTNYAKLTRGGFKDDQFHKLKDLLPLSSSDNSNKLIQEIDQAGNAIKDFFVYKDK